MSKTIRNKNDYYHKNYTHDNKHDINDHDMYIPYRHLSKEYTSRSIMYKGMEYNGHSPQDGAKRRLNGELRAKLKEEERNEINQIINFEENETL